MLNLLHNRDSFIVTTMISFYRESLRTILEIVRYVTFGRKPFTPNFLCTVTILYFTTFWTMASLVYLASLLKIITTLWLWVFTSNLFQEGLMSFSPPSDAEDPAQRVSNAFSIASALAVLANIPFAGFTIAGIYFWVEFSVTNVVLFHNLLCGSERGRGLMDEMLKTICNVTPKKPPVDGNYPLVTRIFPKKRENSFWEPVFRKTAIDWKITRCHESGSRRPFAYYLMDLVTRRPMNDLLSSDNKKIFILYAYDMKIKPTTKKGQKLRYDAEYEHCLVYDESGILFQEYTMRGDHHRYSPFYLDLKALSELFIKRAKTPIKATEKSEALYNILRRENTPLYRFLVSEDKNKYRIPKDDDEDAKNEIYAVNLLTNLCSIDYEMLCLPNSSVSNPSRRSQHPIVCDTIVFRRSNQKDVDTFCTT